MAIAVATQETTNQAVARPLKVLVPLIKEDIVELAKSKDKAASPYYVAIGEKLLEAKANPEEDTGYGYWYIWLKDNFKLSPGTATHYMNYATQVKSLATDKDLTYSEYYKMRRMEGKKQKNPASARTQADQQNSAGQTTTSAGDAKRQAAKLEKEALRKIALKIIDTGYKVLSKKTAPGRGRQGRGF
jgi:hypothetical protein